MAPGWAEDSDLALVLAGALVLGQALVPALALALRQGLVQAEALVARLAPLVLGNP